LAAKIKFAEGDSREHTPRTRRLGNPNVEYAMIRMDNINGTHIYGQLAKPRSRENFLLS